MILIADSGSTKTDWALVGANGSVEYYRTGGLNPVLQSLEDVEREVSSLLRELPAGFISMVRAVWLVRLTRWSGCCGRPLVFPGVGGRCVCIAICWRRLVRFAVVLGELPASWARGLILVCTTGRGFWRIRLPWVLFWAMRGVVPGWVAAFSMVFSRAGFRGRCVRSFWRSVE